jgi:hypothetical protein
MTEEMVLGTWGEIEWWEFSEQRLEWGEGREKFSEQRLEDDQAFREF